MSDPSSQIAAQLKSTKNLAPNARWLTDFLATQRSSIPLNALIQTVLFRLLTSDFTISLDLCSSKCFPVDVDNVTTKERRLSGLIPVQVLGVEDLSKSRWEQVEAIEAIERGESTKGREIIRVPIPDDVGASDSQTISRGGGPHRLILQDAAGRTVFGLELQAVEGIGLGMNIGCKLVLNEAAVARGVVLIEPAKIIILGGKIERLHKAWKESRKGELTAAVAS